MKRKLIISILLILIFIVSANICFADDDGAPAGTPISTAAQFFALSASTGDYYLTGDIDISGYPNKQIAFFRGNLDGNGHSIKNYTINDQKGIFGNDRWYFASLFKESEGASFKNLKI